jgi:uncharacterized protein
MYTHCAQKASAGPQENYFSRAFFLDSRPCSQVGIAVHEANMKAYWASLAILPPEGVDFVLEDAAMWRSLVEELHLDFCQLQNPKAALRILPVEGGCLVRGRITGTFELPCSRCAEHAAAPFDEHFEHFVSLPSAGDDEADTQEYGEEAHLRILAGGTPELDLVGLCGEEFVLALPVKALCAPDCKGLCPECGANRNNTLCSCASAGDPRLATLRALTIEPLMKE